MQNPLHNQKFIVGLIIYAIAVVLFGSTFFLPDKEAVFFINFLFVWIYRIVIWEGRWKFPDRNQNILFLLIANVSAYSLNRILPVFDVSTNWLAAYLIVLNGALLAYCFRKQLPDWIEYTLVPILASGLVFNLYESFYLLPLYPFSIIASFFFLFSLHSFLPIWWLIFLSKLTAPYFNKDSRYLYLLIAGLLIPIFISMGFITQWYTLNRQIKSVAHQTAIKQTEPDLPRWVALSQVIEDGWMSRKILKAGLVYAVGNINIDEFTPSFGRMNERKKHDPFVVIASALSKPIQLKGAENKHLLNAVFNQRHQTEPKLWSGKDLETTNVATTIEVFPASRIAYTEKVINIALNRSDAWPRQQEALYTFYLPEGAVVTSASLWVDGEERPSYLTTRNKADKAYKRIVGRERRDPLLIHWQEGNRVTVRVFPVRFNLPRQFKIGITSPLIEKEGELIYTNPDFDGPYWEFAKEQTRIIGVGDQLSFLSKLAFERAGNDWTYEGIYQSDWQLQMEAPLLSNDVFSYQDNHFQLVPYQATTTFFKAESIYLDINKSWSKKEFNQIWEQIKDRKVFAHIGYPVPLTESNKDHIFKRLQEYNFSLFPFHLITSPSTSLVITKNNVLTPVLDDLKGTTFLNKLNDFVLKNPDPIKVFDFGTVPSLYLKSLKELRRIHSYTDDIETLSSFLQRDLFIQNMETDQLLLLPNMGIGIQQVQQATASTTAPDHLMRLYTYNDLMRKIGLNYFKREKLEDALVAQAEQAFVVSPVSSLIVLETQADYDRFNIKKSKDSLKNASIKNAGSVPEPGEWLLIILSLSIAIFLWWKLNS